MDILNIINAIVVSLGVPAIICAAIYVGRKLQILDDLKGVRDRFAIVESRVGDLWEDKLAPAHSPRQLNEHGRKVLEMSGIKTIIDTKKEKLLKLIKERNVKNPYDAEQVVLEIVRDLPQHCPETIDELKNGAFKSGVGLDGVLFVGGIYLRDLIFPELGFSINDLDKSKTI